MSAFRVKSKAKYFCKASMWPDRKAGPCPSHLSQRSTESLILTCPACKRYYLQCCGHDDCHSFQLVFTDGACPRNGQPDARAGLGAAIGVLENHKQAISVDDLIDDAKRSNQRAELLAAIHGLRLLAQQNHHIHSNRRFSQEEADPEVKERWIIATDSEHVTKGMTEWLPKWKVSLRILLLH